MTIPQAIAVLPKVSLATMESYARRMADMLAPGDIVTLSGVLGAGKTSFARTLILAMAPSVPEVTSPTFTLMHSYEVLLKENKPEIVWHLDLYRLENGHEVEALGLEELWPHITLIEWPEVAEDAIPKERLAIMFDFDDAETRTLTFSGNDAWRERLAGYIP